MRTVHSPSWGTRKLIRFQGCEGALLSQVVLQGWEKRWKPAQTGSNAAILNRF
jgi:hypothetical protein